MCVCVRACVQEREREEGGREGQRREDRIVLRERSEREERERERERESERERERESERERTESF